MFRLGIFKLAVCFALTGVATQSVAQGTPKAEDFAEKVLEYARTDLQQWITDPIIIFAIQEQNKLNQEMSAFEIKRLDKIWREEGKFGLMVVDLLDRQASVMARDRREASNGVVNEIIVMDAHGLNVAISDRTSDFFQGDEAKWQETFLNGPEAVHVSELEFDESTQKVQTQVSLSVTDPETGEVIGAVTLGVSLDRLLN